MELLELGEFVRGAPPDVQAKIAVEVSQLEHARKIARFDVPDHAARILVAACPLLDNRPVGRRAVPGIQAESGAQVPNQEARGTWVDADDERGTPRLVIEVHLALRLELVELGWGISGAIGVDHARAASTLLDGQAGPIAVAALWSRLETLAAAGIDQRPISRGTVSSSRQRRRKDYG